MAGLKLVNNFRVESERNLCFVNSALQLLYSLPEVRNFFINQEYKINQDETADLRICNEVSRIFKTAGHCTTTAATLRLLVGCKSENVEMCSGSQQDITDFLRLLLQQIEIELSELDGPQTLFINKFWGREHVVKKFLDSSDGKCVKCGKLPRQEREDFNMLKINVIKTSQYLSLNDLIVNYFSEGSDTFKMKCSECCPHLRKCPLTDACKLRDTVDQKLLFRTPKYLFIQLLRFDHYRAYKNNTIIIPEEFLTLPNGDAFKLVGIADHIGTLIQNGHYVCNVRTDDEWLLCDDDRQSGTFKPISSNNYIILYSKINIDPKSNLNDYTTVNKEKERNTVCKNCKKTVNNLAEHFAQSLICKQIDKLKPCKVNLPKIIISEPR